MSGTGNPVTLVMDADKVVSATFSDPAAMTYSLTVSTVGSGTVTLDPDKVFYDAGETVTLTAEPATGFVFDGWGGDLSGTGNPVTLVMDADKVVSATFSDPAAMTYSLTVTPVGSGAVLLDPPGGGPYPEGTAVQLTAVAAAGWQFVDWSGDVSGTANSVEVIMTDDFNIIATFESDITPPSGPTIDVWYGNVQWFGEKGQPQNWVNILGNVSDPQGVSSLTYSLNGGDMVNLRIGPDNKRLHNPGDFNADLDITSLYSGYNTLELRAEDGDGNVSVKNVTVNYQAGTVWPLPYNITWSDFSILQDIQLGVQVVDGKWRLDNGNVRTDEPGYDRLIAVGDMDWRDYEVTVPITINSDLVTTYNIGAGVLFRWKGHTDEPVVTSAPKSGFYPLGAILWYTKDRLEIYGNNGDILGRKSIVLSIGTKYWFKASVETIPGVGGLYKLKVWPDGQTEPVNWDLTGQEQLSDPQSGSMMLIAHNRDVSFGNVTVNPLTPTIEYSLNVSTLGSGQVTLNPPGGTYGEGTLVQLTAVADSGYAFDGWSGDVTGSANPVAITMDGDKAVTASFVAVSQTYTLTTDIVGGGSVQLDPPGGTYGEGTVVQLTAIADSGYAFDSWIGDVTGSNNPVAITMDGDKIVTASFVAVSQTYSLTTDIVGGGVVQLDPPGGTYSEGTVVELTAVADSGYVFDSWSGDVTGSDNPVAITMDGDKAVTANFMAVSQTYSLTTDIVGGGSVQLDPPGGTYSEGTVVELTAVADSGFAFDVWSGDVTGSDNPVAITMDGDKTVTASFVAVSQTYTLTTDIVGGGSVQLDPPGGTYGEGTVVQLTAIADSGYAFDVWSGDVTGSDNPVAITMDGDKAVTASFVAVSQTYSLTADIVGGGSVQLDPPGGTYGEGTVVQLTAVSDSGYVFDSWSGDVTGSDNAVAITMDGNKTVTAYFSEAPFFYYASFTGSTAGDDPSDWLDTTANNSMTENDSLFKIFDLSGEKVYGTNSTLTNIHSHYVGAGSESLTGYEYTGRMMMTSSKSGIGVTFYSQYPARDAYYRLRRYSNKDFHLEPHGTTVTGVINTGVVPLPNVWYRFKIQVEDTGGIQTEIHAKVWQEGTGEPAAWQVNAVDASTSRLTTGTFGLWSYYSGSKYWDDLYVMQLD